MSTWMIVPSDDDMMHKLNFHKYIDKVMGKNGKWRYIYEDTKKKVKNKVKQVSNNVNKAVKNVKNAVEDVADSVTGAVKNLYNKGKDAFNNAVRNLVTNAFMTEDTKKLGTTLYNEYLEQSYIYEQFIYENKIPENIIKESDKVTNWINNQTKKNSNKGFASIMKKSNKSYDSFKSMGNSYKKTGDPTSWLKKKKKKKV